jgi:uncharacterized protein (TIGR03437 family)
LALILVGGGSAFGETPDVLNLSHDLVADGIAGQNMVPNSPSLDARPLFQAGVNYASKNHIPTVTVDRGSYYFLSQNSTFQHVFLNGITNVTVDLQYSDLYFANRNILGLQLANCVNVTLKNFTADYLQLPFTQVTVTGVNASARTLNFAQSGNYPLPSVFNSLTLPSGYVDDGYFVFVFRNGQELRGTGRMAAAGPLNDTSIQITDTAPWAQSSQIANVLPGDTLVINRRAGLGTIFAGDCTGLTVQNVSIYASGFIGVLTIRGSAITIDHVQVIPRPGTDRRISTNADGIHLGHAGANNVVSNNTIRRGCDDAIAMDGEWSAIVNAPNNGASVQVARLNTAPLPVGASFDFINILDGTVIGTASIVSESPAPSQQTGAAGELVTLTLDHAVNGLQKNFGVTVSDPLLRGSGTVIRGNLIQEEVFARGIYPTGVSNVTITDNMIHATNQSGILVEQDEGLTYNFKTGPSSGLTIQNNIVDQALGFGVPSNPLLTAGAAINVVTYDQNFAWVSTTPLSNISITGNFVTNSIRSGIRMENVAGGQITGNTLLNDGTDPSDYLWYLPKCCETSAQVQADFRLPVVVTNSSSVTNSNNTTTGQWIANLSNADGGYRLAPESIAVAYGQNLAPSFIPAGVQPLPLTLGGLSVTVKDSAGVSRPAGLYYISQGQVAYVVPKGTASGAATVTVGSQPSAAFVASVGPGLLAANGNATGVALAGAARYSADGTQVPVPVFQCGSAGCVSVPMDLGAPTDILAVVFYGTGFRGNSSLTNVVAQIGGVPATVVYAGAQSQYDGLDQLNVYVPRSLAGAGEVPIVLTVDGITGNVVTLNIK